MKAYPKDTLLKDHEGHMFHVVSSEMVGNILVYQVQGEHDTPPFGITADALRSHFEILRVPGTAKLIADAARAVELIPADELEEYAARVRQLEDEGLTTSDAQGVADVEWMRRKS